MSQHGFVTRNSNPIDFKKKPDSHGTQHEIASTAIKVHDQEDLDSHVSYSEASSWKPQLGDSKILNTKDLKSTDQPSFNKSISFKIGMQKRLSRGSEFMVRPKVTSDIPSIDFNASLLKDLQLQSLHKDSKLSNDEQSLKNLEPFLPHNLCDKNKEKSIYSQYSYSDIMTQYNFHVEKRKSIEGQKKMNEYKSIQKKRKFMPKLKTTGNDIMSLGILAEENISTD